MSTEICFLLFVLQLFNACQTQQYYCVISSIYPSLNYPFYVKVKNETELAKLRNSVVNIVAPSRSGFSAYKHPLHEYYLLFWTNAPSKHPAYSSWKLISYHEEQYWPWKYHHIGNINGNYSDEKYVYGSNKEVTLSRLSEDDLLMNTLKMSIMNNEKISNLSRANKQLMITIVAMGLAINDKEAALNVSLLKIIDLENRLQMIHQNLSNQSNVICFSSNDTKSIFNVIPLWLQITMIGCSLFVIIEIMICVPYQLIKQIKQIKKIKKTMHQKIKKRDHKIVHSIIDIKGTTKGTMTISDIMNSHVMSTLGKEGKNVDPVLKRISSDGLFVEGNETNTHSTLISS